MNRFMHHALALAIAAGSLHAANPTGLKLTTDKQEYLPYEPVYLKVEAVPGSPSNLQPLEFSQNILTITPPRGESFDYRPPILACNTNPSAQKTVEVAYATLVQSGGKMLTAQTGHYTLMIDGDPNSMASFQVVAPRTAEDLAAMRAIEASAGQYAQFISLEGGDHLTSGLAVHKGLAAGRSRYAEKARSLLAINYTQSFSGFGLPGGKARPKDLREVRKYFPADMSALPEHLQISVASAVGDQFAKDEIPVNMRERFRLLKLELQKRPGMKAFSDRIKD